VVVTTEVLESTAVLRATPSTRDGDGYFGPESVTWRILSDPSAWLGGGRAFLVQALHPGAMSVFAQNSGYRNDPWGRLHHTALYVEAAVFGTRAQADKAGERIRRYHAKLRAVPGESGQPRRASDADLMLWVHATTVHSFLVAYRRFAYRLPDADADRYVREMVRCAELVGLSASDVPASAGALSEYLRGVTGLGASDEAREAMKMILFFPPIPLALRPTWAIVSSALVSLLPRTARDLYGLRWSRVMNPPVKGTMFALSRLYNILLADQLRQRFSGLQQTEGGS
jgi:uncharacterized protein (DUF2236 family)